MNERVVPKMINFRVVKLSNSLAITCFPRLELDHFESQPDSPRINQRLPKIDNAGQDPGPVDVNDDKKDYQEN